MYQQSMVPNHDTKYEENPSCPHGGMLEDGQTDLQMNWMDGPKMWMGGIELNVGLFFDFQCVSFFLFAMDFHKLSFV